VHDDHPQLVRLVRAIADGTHVDWDEADRLAAESAEQPLFEALRDLARIAWFHRAQQLAAGPATAPAPPRSAPSGESAPARPAGGPQWCHLELRRKLGEGVFGEVYLAWDPKLEREVALKLTRSAPPGLVAPGLIAPHLLHEGRALARLRHPNVVTVHGADVAEGRVGIWMEIVHGDTLEDLLLERGPFGASEAALAGIDLCRALGAVHRVGLVHRDVKAKNVMREVGGRIVLMDFGSGIDLAPSGQSVPTMPAGTPVYLAPEIFKGRRASPRSDLYSLGVLLYHLVTGAFPVDGETLRDIALAHERGTARLLREERPDLPEAFVQVVERALARNPEDRFPSAGQMEHALAAVPR
jgi:serine/threonine-protein kinase